MASGAPADASQNADGFRFYAWPGGDSDLHRKYGATEKTDVLSVTSIRSLVGEPYQLVMWKVSNVVNLAMGVRKSIRIGPKGGVYDTYVKDGPFPGEFVSRMVASDGEQAKLDALRRWLREQADEPRDVAAVRGTIVHSMIETTTPMSQVVEPIVRNRFEVQWKAERRKVKPEVTADDIAFVTNAMRQYWDMRMHVPFVILAQEPQVWNLKAGYAGSADVLLWFLPDGTALETLMHWQTEAFAGRVTVETIAEVGGFVALGDWKTSKGVYTNHVVQGTAYMAAQFVGSGGQIDERLTELLHASKQGVLFHIRPNQWTVDWFAFREDILQAFLGSVAFARFLAFFKAPTELFLDTKTGVAPGTDKSEVADDSE